MWVRLWNGFVRDFVLWIIWVELSVFLLKKYFVVGRSFIRKKISVNWVFWRYELSYMELLIEI